MNFFIWLLISCSHFHKHTHTVGFSASGVTNDQQRSCCESDGRREEGKDRTGMKMKEIEEHILPLSDYSLCVRALFLLQCCVCMCLSWLDMCASVRVEGNIENQRNGFNQRVRC